ncbi:MAG: saccharopine dehydrogenase family protein [Sphingobium sp.]
MAGIARDFDIVVYGASGFTGRLVAEYLATNYKAPDAPRWAMAGRSVEKLAQVRDEIGAPDDTPLIAADASDPASLAAMAAQARVVLTTVGPYQLYGNELVAACAQAGTDYVDLCGEPAWMRYMIDANEAAAKASGARIVFSCGFDSIPFDMGVHQLQKAVIARHGKPAPRIKGRVRKMRGSASGGTVASMKATMAAATKSLDVVRLLKDPFALTPGFAGPHQPSGLVPEYDRAEGVWAVPFIMAPINTKNVHRSNQLLGHLWGEDLVYDEMMLTTLGEAAHAAVEAMAKLNPFGDGKSLEPGDGPSKEERENGFYEIVFTAEELPGGEPMKLVVTGDRDPGYGSTSKMIAESALCLLRDVEGPGGIWTPASAMGDALVARLEANAGLSFKMDG